MHTIRRFQPEDWASVWPMLQQTFASGDTYAFSPASTEAEIHGAWVELPLATYVACSADGEIIGTYILKPNQPGLGSHVCNCGYVVSDQARGQGIASAMCEHSQTEAIRLGFRAMQFNFVVSTNEGAVRLWQKLGFHIAGTLPGAFRHTGHGYVDAFVMFKQLVG
ncbi:GNAT family N-acetyltransferase [Chitinimonas arctica]|uniref:GNAT family N-acetyltransferase n=1 Tax=Chitinimonas arctica TaxID=2594795 RepID=A0A516SFS5_9NEIS|nr:GNAT family N-acetyltransferase [Chitinimonas arctica]QDQ27017.1 GNAT family N-acetyltransferase [Chitinimonas arctica]